MVVNRIAAIAPPPPENQRKEPDKRPRIRYGLSDIAEIKTKNNPQSGIEPHGNNHLTDSNSIHPGLELLPSGFTV